MDYKWNFESEIKTGKIVTNKFEEKGYYEICLEVTDDQGCNNSITKTVDIIDNQPPETPQRPFGRKIRQNGTYSKYYTRCVDPDGDNLLYLWSWGDGNMSNWIGPFESGVICSWYHSWENAGEYEINVKAKDIH